MNDYCNGIAYATGCIVTDEGKKYLVVRNLDVWYVDQIAGCTGYNKYKLDTNIERDGVPCWVVKARNICGLPPLDEIKSWTDFCRAYIEIHGSLDIRREKNTKGNRINRLRLRIYGRETLLNKMNDILPAKNKKMQYIVSTTEGKYIGRTCALYYQSRKEILDILDWIDGAQKNKKIWKKWDETMRKAGEVE